MRKLITSSIDIVKETIEKDPKSEKIFHYLFKDHEKYGFANDKLST